LIAGYQWDYVFDWTVLKHQQTSQRPLPPPQIPPPDEHLEGGTEHEGGTAGRRFEF